MKKILLPSLLLLFIISSAYLFLPSIYPINSENIDLPNDDNNAVQLRELEMLADPVTGKIPAGIRYKELAFLLELQNETKDFYKKTRGAVWTNRGPWNVGGRTRAFAVDVTNENHILAGGVSGGIWQSFDGGDSWTKVSDPNGHPGVVSITQDTRPGKTNLWYALSGEFYGTSASGGESFYLGDGAFKSLDNGASWSSITSTAGGTPNSFTSAFQGGWRIATSPVDSVNACLYMATYGTVFRSADTGKTWKAIIGNSGNQSYFTDVKVTSTGIVYASLSTGGTTKGFFRSGNGVNFINITPAFLKSHNRTVIEINPNNENEVYFLSELPSDTSGGITTANYEGELEYVSLLKYNYVSGDGTGSGGIWTNLSGNLPVTSTNPFDRFNCQGGYDLFVKMQPGSNTLIIGGTNIYRSTDGFNSKNNISQIGGYGVNTTLPFFTVYLNHHPDQHEFYFSKSNPSKVYSINDGGIFYSDNINSPTVEWKLKTYGYLTSQLYTLAIDEVNAYDTWMLAGFQDNGNYVSNSNNPQHHWLMPVNGDGTYEYIAPDKSFFVMGTQLGRLVKTELDKHGNLIARRRIDPAPYKKSDYQFINPFIVDPNDDNILYTPIGKKMARLNSLRDLPVNNNYSQLSSGWTIFDDSIKTNDPDAQTKARITTMAVSKSEPNVLYVGTNNMDIYRVENAHTGQPTMIKLDTTASTHRLSYGGYVSDIAIDPDSAKNVLICYSNYNVNSLFYTNNYGNTWYYVGGNLEKGAMNPTGGDPSIRSVNILVDANGKRTYFAGTSIGLFSTDSIVLSISSASALNKTVWKQESVDKIGSAIVTDIKVRRSDGYVAVATHGNGAYESYFTGNTPPSIKTVYPEVTAYPNPAGDKIYFNFDATNTSNYKAEIYDASGRRVNAMVNGINNNNVFTQTLDVSKFANGHYFIAFYTSDKRKLVKHFIVHH